MEVDQESEGAEAETIVKNSDTAVQEQLETRSKILLEQSAAQVNYELISRNKVSTLMCREMEILF